MSTGIADETIVAFKVQIDQAISQLRMAQKTLRGVTTEGETSVKMTNRTGDSFTRMARQVVIAVGAVKGVMAGVNFNAFIESTQLAFGVMLKDFDLAKQKMEEFQEYALTMPVVFKDAIAGARQLFAYGIPENQIIKTLTMLGNISRGLAIRLDDLVYLYGTLRTQGRAYTRDMTQFAQRGIPIYEALAEVMAVPIKNIKQLVEEGKVGFPEVEQAFKLMTQEGGKFAGLMQKSMETYDGMLTAFKNLTQVSLGRFTEGIFNAVKGALPAFTAQIKENIDGIEAFGESVGRIFNGLITFVIGLVEYFSTLPSSINMAVKALIGAGGFLVAIKLIIGAMNKLFSLSFTLFSPQGVIIAAVAAITFGVIGMIGAMKQARIETAKLDEKVQDMLGSIREDNLKEGKWELIPGMDAQISSIAKITGTYSEALALSEKIVAIDKQMTRSFKWVDYFSDPIVSKVIGDSLDTLNRLAGFDPAAKLSNSTEQLKNLLNSFSNTKNLEYFRKEVQNVYKSIDSLRTQATSDQMRKFIDDMKESLISYSGQLEELIQLRQIAVTKMMDKSVIQAIDDGIKDLTDRYYKDYLPMFEDLIDTIGGVEGAGVKLIERLREEYEKLANSSSAGTRWWDWLSERLGVALDKFTTETEGKVSPIANAGRIAAEAYLQGFKTPMADAKLLSDLIEDEGKYYAEAAESQMKGIFTILEEMFSEATRKSIPIEDWFKSNDQAVQTLVAEYMRLKRIVEEVKGVGEDWIKSWLSGFGKLYDAYREFSATFQQERMGVIDAVALYELQQAKEQAVEILDNEMKNFEVAKEAIRDKYGLEFESAREMHDTVMRWINQEYQYKIDKIHEEAKIANMVIASSILSARLGAMQNTKNYSEQIELANQLHSLRMYTINMSEKGKQLELALLEEELRYENEIAGIDNNKLQMILATEAILSQMNMMDLKAGLKAGGLTKDKLELITKIYWREIAIAKVNLSGNELTLKLMQLEEDKLNAINDMYKTQYDILIHGNKAFWDSYYEQAASGNLQEIFGASVSLGLEGSELGTLISLIGSGNILQAGVALLGQAFVNAAGEVDGFTQILNPITTAVKGLFTAMGPFLAGIIAPLVNLLSTLLLFLTPILAVLGFLQPILQALSRVFIWLYNEVLIDWANGMIFVINTLIEWVNQFRKQSNKFDYVKELLRFEEHVEAVNDALDELIRELEGSIDYLANQLKNVIKSQIDSLQDLYEVGALSASSYQSQVDALMDQYGHFFQSEFEQLYGNLTDPDAIVRKLEELKKELRGIQEYQARAELDRAGFTSDRPFRPLATGSASTQDEVARLHEGEMVVPRSFADAVRRGEIVIGDAGSGSNGITIAVSLNVEGSVLTERDLALSMSEAMSELERRGYIARNR